VKGKLRVVIGLLLSAGAIAFILRDPQKNALVWANVRAADIPLLTLSAFVATLIFPLRAIRWKAILHPVDPDLSQGLLWRATSAGFALNNILPARLGEVARAYALSRSAPTVSFPTSFASLAVDRVFDAIVIIGLLMIGLLGVPASGSGSAMGQVYGNVLIIVVVIAALAGALFALAFFPSRIIRLYQLFARRIMPPLEVRGSAILASFATGLSVLRSPRRFAIVFFWTVIHWLVNALAFWIGFQSIGLEIPSSGLAALATQSIVALAVAIPAGPAFIGVFQASGQLALGLFGVPPEPALAWGFAFWAFSFIPITVIGMVNFARMGLTLREIREMVASVRGSPPAQPNV
jgi:uncharacterized protein (TIRG00374 family)